MPWHRRETWDEATLSTYAALAAARREHPALVHGGLRWAHVDEDCLAFLREHPAGTVLVVARRAAGAPLDLPLPTTPELLLSTEPDGPVDGPSVTLWAV
jgi:alpha-glucosidase